MNKREMINILNREMELATGCTEPAAIAFTCAVAADHLAGGSVERIRVRASGNIIKNAMSASIPGTPYAGVEYASAIGAVVGDSKKKLQVFDSVDLDSCSEARDLVVGQRVSVEVADTSEKLYVDVVLEGLKNTSRAVLSGSHTNIIRIEENGRAVYEGDAPALPSDSSDSEGAESLLSIQDIFKFVSEIDTANDPLDIVRESISVNSAISEEGLQNDYGLRIGKTMRKEQASGIIGNDMMMDAANVTAAGADARMAGAPFPVVTNSGSGNQGIAATMPVVVVAKRLGSGEDKMIRAVTLSNLVTIYIKSKFGKLSAFCGAAVAATGAACGITYLMGGGLKAIEYAVQNMIGNITGMICDGAKSDCALKIYSCTQAAMSASILAMREIRVQKTDGIVENDVEKTIENLAALSEGSMTLDHLILHMMLHKEKC